MSCRFVGDHGLSLSAAEWPAPESQTVLAVEAMLDAMMKEDGEWGRAGRTVTLEGRGKSGCFCASRGVRRRENGLSSSAGR